ncbi:LAMI_0A03202g1_1 [Lachancea mirantina]|uniref:LAMI_0A03202g1_1 n=1 Tax=Lachancea mirantina TaxID=1230905 RepID=A0A1G4IN43_9SACH|nr:LAMI_0A03202g1_1 [Lachancea mirantina]
MANEIGGIEFRRRVFSDIFGVERPSEEFRNKTTARDVPNRIEHIDALDDALLSDIERDIIPLEAQNYILMQETQINNISDTQSLSSTDDLSSVDSPRKQLQSEDHTSLVLQNQHIVSPDVKQARRQPHVRPVPPPINTALPAATEQPSPQRSKSESLGFQTNSTRRIPSLTQLHRNTQLKKQPTHSSIFPTSKKSPLQGFGLFSRPASKEVMNVHQMHHNTQAMPNQNSLGARSLSLSSTSFKSFASPFQQKTAGGRTIPQKCENSTNPFLEHGRQQSQSSMGLGIKSRSSSASLQTGTTKVASSPSLNFHRRSSASIHSKPIVSTTSMTRPQVYPAMLSRVATKFRKSVHVGEHKKDGLLYRDAFTGRQAVDAICSIIRTSDRNLALLLGRALDAQKLFHDVVYEHRLRDSPNEVYEFTGNSRIIGTGTTGLAPVSAHAGPLLMDMSSGPTHTHPSTSTLNTSQSSISVSSAEKQVDPAKMHNVNGVFTLLAECYSPTCTRTRLCYSISCPRRLEQQARLNLKPNGGLKRNFSVAVDDEEDEKPSWTSSVPESIWSELSKKEIKRQEAIYEVYTTERNFVKSLEIIRDTFMKTLAETNIIPADIRKNFIKHVFAHVNDMYSVNRRFLDSLSDRQKSSPIVNGLGDIFLRFIPFFEPFVMYVASRPYAKYLIETQRSVNPYFSRFDEDLMSSPLRHGIDSFLSQGVSRPGRYILLAKEIIKSSDPGKNKRDLENMNRALDALRAFMQRIDKASGAAQDRHDIELLKQKILFKNEYVNLGLNDGKRKIKHEGVLCRKESSKTDTVLGGDVQFYLLDNMLLFLKAKAVNKWQQHKVFQRPIPLPLLFACAGEDMPPLKKLINSKPGSCGTVVTPEVNYGNPRNAICFLYYGAKHHYQVTLYAAQYAALQTLLEKIKLEQQTLLAAHDIFNIEKLSGRFFDYTNKINSVASCDGGRKLVIATNSGLYVSATKREQVAGTEKMRTYFGTPQKIIQRNNITQLAVLEEFQSILLLVDKKLYSCPLVLLDEQKDGTQYFRKHGKELVNHVNFFSEGDCNGKRLIVTAHTSSHSIKLFEHEHPMLMEGRKNLKRKITEVVFDSEPVSISFLRANLCIGCKKGFQVVSIPQTVHEPLLDPADTSLEFALKDILKPVSIYRVASMYLLCYSEFAFFVNSQGWRKKESFIIYWEGEPQKFAIWYPYILAFDTNFIEVRKIETGELVRCVLGEKIRLLQATSQQILYAYEDEAGYDTIASIDFWGK